ncbi:hypothetical protein EYF80_015050 [Liparis tanakae]|uniref:Uncharacterized protein n=1 Tax=Liparis tanakae TaxID=230148 RepID=A0A4Z2IBE6_9TELE|nr:hypothetical protein EYF80_015050 [Liparis tanakae]
MDLNKLYGYPNIRECRLAASVPTGGMNSFAHAIKEEEEEEEEEEAGNATALLPSCCLLVLSSSTRLPLAGGQQTSKSRSHPLQAMRLRVNGSETGIKYPSGS